MSSVGVALVGAGPWGLTLARALERAGGSPLRWICELDADRRADAARRHPDSRVTARLDSPPDHHAEHEHEPDDHRAAEEQIEDLTTVEADLDLVLVELCLARHTSSIGKPDRPDNYLVQTLLIRAGSRR